MLVPVEANRPTLHPFGSVWGCPGVHFGLHVGLCPWRGPATHAEGRKRPMKHTAAGDLCWRAPSGGGQRSPRMRLACTSGFPSWFVCSDDL